jgi:hypothetical protein
MPVEISWQQPNRVLHEHFYGSDLDLVASMQVAQQGIVQEFEELEGPIHLIVDLSEMTEPPASLVEMRHRIQVPNLQKLGYIVFVTGKNPVVQYFASILSQVILKGKPFTFVDTLDEALQYLRERDETVTFEHIERKNE